MITKTSKNQARQRIHTRMRKRLMGTAERPRLSVYRSLNHLYAQLINDLDGITLVAVSTSQRKAADGKRAGTGGNVAAARDLGRQLAMQAKEKGIAKVVFDRGGYQYHGRVKALADAAREGGLQF